MASEAILADGIGRQCAMERKLPPKRKKNKRVSEGQESIIVVPVVLEVVQLEVTPVVVQVEDTDVAIVPDALDHRTRHRPCHHSLNILGVESYSGSPLTLLEIYLRVIR